MTSRDFCYWLQGYFELGLVTSLSETQVKVIRNHLAMVFKHEIDPSHGDADHQLLLDQLHQGGPSGLDPKPPSTASKPPRYRC